MRFPHLAAFLAAILVLVSVLLAGRSYAENVEGEYIHALAPMRFQQKLVGAALQNQAFRHSDLLPLYGSSELIIADAYHPNKIFRLYPTGFAPFVLGNNGAQPLNFILKLSSVGSDLNGKKVVILLSSQFFTQVTLDPSRYAGNYSRLQAYKTAFSGELSFALKHRIATRLLDYPDTLKQDAFLESTLELLTGNSLWNTLGYYALLPLGDLNIMGMELQDHWETVNFIWQQKDLDPAMPRRAAPFDWPDLVAKAEKSYAEHSNNNPFGFDNLQWDQFHNDWLDAESSLTDEIFLKNLRQSQGWNDLDLLLQTLKEMKAQPLILGIPIAGRYADFVGVSSSARAVYYQLLQEAIQPYGVPLEQFADHEDDTLFFYNPGAHLSSKGWVYFSRSMDAFYHDAPVGDQMYIK